MTFTYNGYEFEGRQTEAANIVWLAGKPEDSERLPRSFSFEEVAEHFILNRDLPEHKETPTDYAKEVRLEVAYDIIGNLDDTALKTEWLEKAIKQLELLKHRRDNLPF